MIQPNTLEHAEHLIKLAGVVDSGVYHFYAEDGVLQVKKLIKTDQHQHGLLIVSGSDLNNGLTPRQWNLLDAAIRTARKEGILK